MRKIAELKSRAKSSGIEVTEDEVRQALNPIGIPENENLTKRDYSDKSWMTKNNNKPNSLKHKIRDTMKGLKGFVTGKEREMMDRGELDTYQDMQNMREDSTSMDEQNSRSQSLKDLISGMDDNHYPSPARPEWDLQGIDTLKVVYSAADAPTEVFRGEKSGLWTIERDDDYPRGNWVTVTVTEPKHFSQFLDIVYSNNPNTKIFINDKVNQGVAEGKYLPSISDIDKQFYELESQISDLEAKGVEVGKEHPLSKKWQQLVSMKQRILRKNLKKGVAEGSLEAEHSDPTVMVSVGSGNPEKLSLSAAIKKYPGLGKAEDVKAGLAKQNTTKIGNYTVSAPMSGQEVSPGFTTEISDQTKASYREKAHKKDMKEGQEDLDAILRIIRK
jgi:hypothetical protein